jgi:DNA-binding CsgD family transcriptional regulator
MDPEQFNEIMHSRLSEVFLDVSEKDYERFESRRSLLETLSEVQNSSVIVFDFHKRDYAYKRIHFSEQMGHDPEMAKELGLAYYISLIHPEDFPILLDTYQKALVFIDSMPVEEKKDFKLIYSFRSKGKDGIYRNLVDQIIVLELDKQGNIWMIMGISDVLPGNNSDEKASRQFINVRTNKLYLFNDEVNAGKPVLSTREIEILGWVSKGFASKEIAEKLFISVNTVNNHRQKILEKTQASNTAEAISFARNLGII